jgi:transcriptional regulator with XRE-family HTH domain
MTSVSQKNEEFVRAQQVKLGVRIRRERIWNNQTIAELAEEVNISPWHLSRIENGHGLPSLELLFRMCATWHCLPVALFTD